MAFMDRYEYDYPNGLNLHPESETHQELLRRILDRAEVSYRVVSSRFDTWDEIDQNLVCYKQPTAEDERLKIENPHRPVSVVVPYAYLTLETILTYFVERFLTPPLLRLSGVGPEDILGAIRLEHLLDYQTRKSKVALALHTQWRDAFAYGYGVTHVRWIEERGPLTTVKEQGYFSRLLGWVGWGYDDFETEEDALLYEGNVLENIHPRFFLPDPNVPIHQVEKMEFAGLMQRTNLVSLLREEATGDLFNVKYVKDLGEGGARSKYFREQDSLDRYSLGQPASITHPTDRLWMYVDLIPKDWGIGEKEYPEKWLFGVAGDQIIIKADPIRLKHNRFPITIFAPEFDGYAINPLSKLETVLGLFKMADFYVNSHAANVAKAVNNMFVVDPRLVYEDDVRDGKWGMLARLRPEAFGQGVDKAIKQIPVTDVTQHHMQDTLLIGDLIQRATGASDSVQGIMRKTSERRSATEARDVRISAISRLEKAAKIASIQVMEEMGYLMAEHTQQFMSDGTYINILGESIERLQKEYGFDLALEAGRQRVNPEDIQVRYDIYVTDGPDNTEDPQSLTSLYQIIANNPELQRQFDIVRVTKAVARALGLRNVSDFDRVAPQTAQVMGPEQIESQMQAGNITPLKGRNGRYQ